LAGSSSTPRFPRLPADDSECDASNDNQHPLGGFIPWWRFALAGLCFCVYPLIICLVRDRKWGWLACLGGGLAYALIGVCLAFAPWGKVNAQGQRYCNDNGWFHSQLNVNSVGIVNHP
jgi:hypothetical protein